MCPETYKRMRRQIQERTEAAQCMVEYALITALIAVVSGYTMVSTPAVADSMKKIFNNVAKYVALAAGASQAISC